MSRQERAAQNSTGGDQSLERPGASGATGASNSKEVENIRHFYNNVYYARSQGAEEEYRTHYQRLFTKVGIHRGDRVLDVACGTGDWLQTCARNGCQVSGVDLSDKAVEICRSRIPAGEFYAQPAETLPFPDQHFDTISCLGSLEHFIDPLASLLEMRRVAKKGAIFILLVPNSGFLTRRLGLFGGTQQVDAKEVVRSLDEWAAIFRDAGLNITRRWKDLHVIHPDWIMRGHPAAWPLRLVQALLLWTWPLAWQYQVYHLCTAENS